MIDGMKPNNQQQQQVGDIILFGDHLVNKTRITCGVFCLSTKRSKVGVFTYWPVKDPTYRRMSSVSTATTA